VYRHAPSPSARIKVAWSGAETKGRSRATTWNGRLRLSEGRIRTAKAYRLDNHDERIEK
jgi:hypothetical protein